MEAKRWNIHLRHIVLAHVTFRWCSLNIRKVEGLSTDSEFISTSCVISVLVRSARYLTATHTRLNISGRNARHTFSIQTLIDLRHNFLWYETFDKSPHYCQDRNGIIVSVNHCVRVYRPWVAFRKPINSGIPRTSIPSELYKRSWMVGLSHSKSHLTSK